MKNCIDETLNMSILVHSIQYQENYEELHRRDFEHANIGPFNSMSRKLHRRDFEHANIGSFNSISREL